MRDPYPTTSVHCVKSRGIHKKERRRLTSEEAVSSLVGRGISVPCHPGTEACPAGCSRRNRDARVAAVSPSGNKCLIEYLSTPSDGSGQSQGGHQTSFMAMMRWAAAANGPVDVAAENDASLTDQLESLCALGSTRLPRAVSPNEAGDAERMHESCLMPAYSETAGPARTAWHYTWRVRRWLQPEDDIADAMQQL